MTAAVENIPATLERIRRTLVGLRMPRAIEVLDQTIRQLERGEVSPLDAIDTLLAEELTVRESRRIKTALVMARLTAVKTLAGFDFSFQPSLDRNRVPRPARVHRPQRGASCSRPARHRHTWRWRSASGR
jgi:DNA replication protein DnaC